MKILLLLALACLPSCESVPITVSYSGAAAGHEFTAGYSTTSGAVAVVKQK